MLFLFVSLFRCFEEVLYFAAYWCFSIVKRARPSKNGLLEDIVRRMEERFCATDLWPHDELMPLLSIPQLDIDNVCPTLFAYMTDAKRRPLVVRQLLLQTDALRYWNLSHFFENYGGAALQGTHSPYSLRSVLEIIHAAEQTENDAPINVQSIDILRDHPELLHDLDLSVLQLLDSAMLSSNKKCAALWLGGLKASSALHASPTGRFYLNVCGKRQFTMIDPRYCRYLKIRPLTNGVESTIDLDDREQFEYLAERIPLHRVTLEPGDCLYMPAWWMCTWKNLSGFSVGCIVQDLQAYAPALYNAPMYMFHGSFWYELHPCFSGLIQRLRGRRHLERLLYAT